LGDVFGDAGAHARSAVSAAALPLGVTVEIEGIFQIK
jgi:enamine deaminase RidA (YjgF/YER057c/UK114 family)